MTSRRLQSLCETCDFMREIVTPKGSRFLLCRRAEVEPLYAKYPPQPLLRCQGHVEPYLVSMRPPDDRAHKCRGETGSDENSASDLLGLRLLVQTDLVLRKVSPAIRLQPIDITR